ncbi:hypothetical protein SEVIR_4G010200v4 [Setaria viridis]|uniref:KIB1-4 beta-propeller domain-containing protein n=1 Tax=Setaria viridis TaxID=4556 RepID=A0A4U6URU9_SETVI|nr:uncharacterized protein LOC117852023 [Setaria viridis]XP_034589830.1 uncharacterized protein LOC117852023 [Setaria viridis]XP_034589831.1 uncharacterized protein LOC117852023 [Setaria viridis]TKW19281.1 hypothetical protein SEVIR_4G010200v2 [Setaria viridis]
MQSHSKISGTSASTTTTRAVCGLRGWADLPEGLLQSIVALLGSFLDLLAFAGTCRSWRAAFSSYPSKSTFCSLLPPLLIRPNIHVSAPHLPSKGDDGCKLRTCQVIDLANPNTPLRSQIPQETFQKLCFAGSSYGQLICGSGRNCLVVDVFTGAEVSPPQLPLSEDAYFNSGMLTAPIASPDSHLLVSVQSDQDYTQRSLLDWPVGSHSWSELQLNDSRIEQIVEFNGQFIAMDEVCRLYSLSLAPQLDLQEITTVWWDDMDECPFLRPWLVVCGDMLLIVGYHFHYISLLSGALASYKAYHLDMSTEPATWVEAAKLENHALFTGGDVRSPAFSSTSPGRWSGRTNCLYYAHDTQPWSLHGLGNDADAVWADSTDPDLVFKRTWYRQLQPFWVYPSMLYSDGQ